MFTRNKEKNWSGEILRLQHYYKTPEFCLAQCVNIAKIASERNAYILHLISSGMKYEVGGIPAKSGILLLT